MTKRLITYAVISAMLIACSGKELSSDETLTIDVLEALSMPATPDFELNDLASQVETFALYTPDNEQLPSMMIQGISPDGTKIVAYGTNGENSVMITGTMKLYVIDMLSGQVNIIDRGGNAPNEYASPSGIDIDDRYVYINDYSKKSLQVYDFEGNYVKSIKNDNLGSNPMIMSDGTIFTDRQEQNRGAVKGDEISHLTMFDKEGTLVDSVFTYTNNLNEGVLPLQFAPLRCDGGFLYMPADLGYLTYYLLEPDGKLLPRITFRFNGVQSICEFFSNLNGNALHLDSDEFAFANCAGQLSNGITSISISRGGDARAQLWKGNKLIANVKANEADSQSIGFNCTLPNGKQLQMSGHAYGKTIYDIIDAYKLEGIVDGIGENDNPVLIKVTVK